MSEVTPANGLVCRKQRGEAAAPKGDEARLAQVTSQLRTFFTEPYSNSSSTQAGSDHG